MRCIKCQWTAEASCLRRGATYHPVVEFLCNQVNQFNRSNQFNDHQCPLELYSTIHILRLHWEDIPTHSHTHKWSFPLVLLL